MVAAAKMYRMINVIQELHSRRYSVKELAKKIDHSERTVERYLVLIEELGIPLEKGFDKKYFIAQDNCPLCGRQPTTTNTNL